MKRCGGQVLRFVKPGTDARYGVVAVPLSDLKLSTRGDAILLDVHVVPRASKTAVVGLHDGRLKVALDAPPVDGAANAALLRFFADALSLRLRDVSLVRGEKGRQKTLAIRGSDEASVRALCLPTR